MTNSNPLSPPIDEDIETRFDLNFSLDARQRKERLSGEVEHRISALRHVKADRDMIRINDTSHPPLLAPFHVSSKCLYNVPLKRFLDTLRGSLSSMYSGKVPTDTARRFCGFRVREEVLPG